MRRETEYDKLVDVGGGLSDEYVLSSTLTTTSTTTTTTTTTTTKMRCETK